MTAHYTQVMPTDALHMEMPSKIEIAGMRFLISDSPKQNNVQKYANLFKKENVKYLCRANLAGYDTKVLLEKGINVYEIPIKDGDTPKDEIVDQWLSITEQSFFGSKRTKVLNAPKVDRLDDNEFLGVHCVAGLGRSPLLVAIALIEFGKMTPLEAVSFIRERRKGAINKKQCKWLEEQYRRRTSAKINRNCSIM